METMISYLGLLINEEDQKYVIPLTSAKPKHATWDDVTANTYRIYEIIDTRSAVMDSFDIIVDIKNKDLLKQKNIPATEYANYKQRILSVLDIKKMFPITEGAYRLAELNIVDGLSLEERQRRGLMQKEYEFCVKIKEDIRRKASQVYNKQIQTGKVLKFHCNFKALEQAAHTYIPSK